MLGTMDGIKQIKYVGERLKLPFCQILKGKEVTNLVRKEGDYLALARTYKEYSLHLVVMQHKIH